MINAAVFDLDDTLYMRSEPWLHAFHAVCGPCPGIDENALFQRGRVTSDEEFDRYNAGEISQREMYIRRISRAVADFGIDMDDGEAMRFQDVYTESLSDIHIPPGMRRLLGECRDRGIFLGIISNGQSARQRGKARALGTEAFLPDDHIMITGDIGIHKPDPRVFEAYADKFDLDPSLSVYVGDNFTNDVKCPHDAGWKTAWILRENLYTEEEVEKAKPWVEVISSEEDQILRYLLQE